MGGDGTTAAIDDAVGEFDGTVEIRGRSEAPGAVVVGGDAAVARSEVCDCVAVIVDIAESLQKL